MAFNKRTVLIAVGAVGLAIVLIAGIGFSGRRETMASRSAAAFREALRKGEHVGASAHGHGAFSQGAAGTATHPGHGGSETAKPEETHAESHAVPGHDMSASSAKSGEHEMPGKSMNAMPAGHAGMQHGTTPPGRPPAGHTGMKHGVSATPPMASAPAGHAGMQHGASGVPPSGTPLEDASGASQESRVAETPPGQPARTLRPDSLDQPAETSVVDATRSLEMAGEMGGMEGMQHGTTSYRQVDAGRSSATPAPVPAESSVTPRIGAPSPHHGMQHGSPRPSPTPVPERKPPSIETKPSPPSTAPTHPPHHHSSGEARR